MSSLKSNSSETTPLQDKLERIATDIGRLGMLAALFIVHALLIRQFIEGLARRRFDLSGGPKMYYSYDETLNPTGKFGNPAPEFAAFKDIRAGRCAADESGGVLPADMCAG